MKIFCMVVLCTCLLMACEKDNDDYEPVKPPIEQPEEPVEPDEPDKPVPPPSIDDIINIKIGDSNMIVGSNSWNAVAYGDGGYMAVGDGGYYTISYDGETWTSPKKAYQNNNWKGVVYGYNKFYLVAEDGYAMSTTDGTSWQSPSLVKSGFKGVTYAMAGSGPKFVAVGYKSPEGFAAVNVGSGTMWSTYRIGMYSQNAVTCGNIYGSIKFVSVGSTGYIAYSGDGTAWTTKQVGSTTWNSVAYGVIPSSGPRFVAVGSNGYVTSSGDGTTWTTPKQLGGGNVTWKAVAFSNDKFIVVGSVNYSGSYTAFFSVSADGVNWTDPKQLKDENGNTIGVDINGICALH